ncbi:Hypothetical protein AA314_02926 [Archangium gephyra]|nr:Hypothetical protein AA314_02926 [Archangium gephyra]
MFRIRMTLALACGALAMGGCATVEQRFCERADECNFLTAGLSADECTDQYMSCTDDLTDPERADWSKLMNECLEFQSCGIFAACVEGTIFACGATSN